MDRISHYRVVSRIGAGGMGVVWRAVDERLGREVAIKVLGRHSSSPERALRMMREAQAASALNHPGIVTVHDVGEYKGQPYVVMELIEGVRFSDLGRQPPTEALRLCALAADALGAAHARGILHRDIKSDNLMRLPDERVKVLDFGLAKVTGDSVSSSGVRSITPVSGTAETMAGDSSDSGSADDSDDETADDVDESPPELADTMASGSDMRHPGSPSGGYVRPVASSAELTRIGDIMGTPAYMSPEQARGEKADARSEVFSLGVVLYELLTGRRPFLGEDVEQTLEAVRKAVVTPPSKTTRDAALAPYDAVVAKILALDPAQRPADMTELAALLRKPVAEAAPARSPRRGWLLGGAAVLALGAGGLAITKLGKTAGDPAVAPRKDAATVVPKVANAVTGIRADRRLTLDDGCEEFPVMSADGSLILYDSARGSDYYLFALDRAGARKPLISDAGWNIAPALSPDGKHVAFLRKAGAPYQAMVTDLDASAPRMITVGGSRPSWSPDGKALWAGSGRKPQRFNLETGVAERTITPPEGLHALSTLELADSSVLGLMLNPETNSNPLGIARFSPTGEMTWLYEGELDEVLVLSPDKQGVIVSHLTASGQRELLNVPLAGGKPTLFASAAVDAHKGLSASADWSRVVWSDCVERTEISTVRKSGSDFQFSTLSGGTWADIDPVPLAGKRQFVVISDRNSEVRPWLVDLDGNAQPRMIVDMEPTRIAVTPDGATLVYEVDSDGIYQVPIAGGKPIKLADSKDTASPSAGPDGRVYFVRGDDMAVRIYTVPLAGGAATPLLPPPSSLPAPSPVGRTLVYAKGHKQTAELTVRDLGTAAEHPLAKELPLGGWTYLRFSADGAKLAATRGQGDAYVVELATGKVVEHVVGRSRTFNSAALMGAHGEDLVIGDTSWNGDIWSGAAER